MSPAELLEKVVDKDSFFAFVNALAEEREDAERLEREDARYKYGGAHDWQNTNISAFLYAGLASFNPKPLYRPELEPSWRMFAEFLYFGKIYE